MSFKSFKYRIYPNKSQQKTLNHTLDLCQFLYNNSLEQKKTYYNKLGKYLSFHEQRKELIEVKEIFTEYEKIHSQVLCDVQDRLDKAYLAAFKRHKRGEKFGHPRFRGKNRYNSFTYPQFKLDIISREQLLKKKHKKEKRHKKNKLIKSTQDIGKPETQYIYLSKIGYIKINYHTPILEKIKACTVQKSKTNKWYVNIIFEENTQFLPKTNNIIGIDLGIQKLITTSNKEVIENPKFMDKHEEKLKKDHQRYSKDPSPKKKKILAKSYEKVTNSRRDYQHKVSKKLVQENDVIILEDLNIKNMIKNNKDQEKINLIKLIEDACWGQLKEYITYKAEKAGKKLLLVNSAYTSKTCSKCDNIDYDLKLKDRTYKCKQCGYKENRDYNAAINIKNRGISQYGDLPEIRDIISSTGCGKKSSANS